MSGFGYENERRTIRIKRPLLFVANVDFSGTTECTQFSSGVHDVAPSKELSRYLESVDLSQHADDCSEPFDGSEELFAEAFLHFKR